MSIIIGTKAVKNINKPIEIFYNDLISYIQSSSLIESMSYKIVDFQHQNYLSPFIPDIHTGPVESLVVTASSNNTLDPQARSTLYPQDIIWYSPIITSNFTTSQGGSEGWVGDKGIIYRRHDTIQDIDLPIDFRHTIIRRWDSAAYPGVYTLNTGPNDGGSYVDIPVFTNVDSVGGVTIRADVSNNNPGVATRNNRPLIFFMGTEIDKIQISVAGNEYMFQANHISHVTINQCSHVDFYGSLIDGYYASGSWTNLSCPEPNINTQIVHTELHEGMFVELHGQCYLEGVNFTCSGEVSGGNGCTITDASLVNCNIFANIPTFISEDHSNESLGSGGVWSVTYNKLVDDISNSRLIPGQKYRIIDYRTVHTVVGTTPGGFIDFGPAGIGSLEAEIHQGTPEVLVVKALTNTELDIRATSELYPNDIIEYSITPRFNIKGGDGSIDNPTPFYGCITFRHDTIRDISAGQDWRNIVTRMFSDDGTSTGRYVMHPGAFWQDMLDHGATPTPTEYLDLNLCSNNPGEYETHNISVGRYSSTVDGRLEYSPVVFVESARNLPHYVEKVSIGRRVDGIFFGGPSISNLEIPDCSNVLIQGEDFNRGRLGGNQRIYLDGNIRNVDISHITTGIYFVGNHENESLGGSLPWSCTYLELKTWIDTNNLIPGQKYKITDFRTRHTIPDTTDINEGPIEPIIVTAISFNKLALEAHSTVYPQDLLYYDVNGKHFTDGVDTADNYGWIYRRYDTINSVDVNFDFRSYKNRWYNDGTGNYNRSAYGSSVIPPIPDVNDYQDLLVFPHYNDGYPSTLETVEVHIGAVLHPDGLNGTYYNATRYLFPKGAFKLEIPYGFDFIYCGEQPANVRFGACLDVWVLGTIDRSYIEVPVSSYGNIMSCHLVSGQNVIISSTGNLSNCYIAWPYASLFAITGDHDNESIGGAQPWSCTYSELTTWVGSSFLIPGQKYKITDFRSRFTLGGYIGADYTVPEIITGSIEPLIVTSISSNKIDKIAESTLYPHHEIYYSLLSRNKRDSPPNGEQGDPATDRGCIYWRYDTLRNLGAPVDYLEYKRRLYLNGVDGKYSDQGPIWVGDGTHRANSIAQLSSISFTIGPGVGSYSTTIDTGLNILSGDWIWAIYEPNTDIRTIGHVTSYDSSTGDVSFTTEGWIGTPGEYTTTWSFSFFRSQEFYIYQPDKYYESCIALPYTSYPDNYMPSPGEPIFESCKVVLQGEGEKVYIGRRNDKAVFVGNAQDVYIPDCGGYTFTGVASSIKISVSSGCDIYGDVNGFYSDMCGIALIGNITNVSIFGAMWFHTGDISNSRLDVRHFLDIQDGPLCFDGTIDRVEINPASNNLIADFDTTDGSIDLHNNAGRSIQWAGIINLIGTTMTLSQLASGTGQMLNRVITIRASTGNTYTLTGTTHDSISTPYQFMADADIVLNGTKHDEATFKLVSITNINGTFDVWKRIY